MPANLLNSNEACEEFPVEFRRLPLEIGYENAFGIHRG